MMMAVWIALTVMMAATLIVNLGLGKAIADVSGKVLNCSTCLSFWGVLAALLYTGHNIVLSVVLSIFAAYLSNFFGIVLMVLNKIYNTLWERNSKNQT